MARRLEPAINILHWKHILDVEQHVIAPAQLACGFNVRVCNACIWLDA
jgi:hypothetical protein